VYEYLSAAFLYPTEPTLELLRNGGVPVLGILRSLGLSQSASTLEQAHRYLLTHDMNNVVEEYVRTFGHTISRDCPPYEGEHGQSHIFQLSQVLADIASFYRAFGLAPAPEARERLDHISVELEFMHVLTLKEAHALRMGLDQDKIAVCQEAQRAFLGQHLGEWACHFARRLQRKAAEGSYYHLAQALETYVWSELEALGVEASFASPAAPSPSADEEAACGQCPMAPADSRDETP